MVITAGLGGGSNTMDKVVLTGGQLLPLLTSQRIIFVPVPRAVTLVKVEFWLAKVAWPLCNAQLPVPTAGWVALITVVGVAAQIV